MVRRQLDIDESMAKELNFEVIFLGELFGIGLSKRSQDEHIMFTILHEDDEHWFTSVNPCDSFWINDLQEVIEEVKKYLNLWAEVDEYGYRFSYQR
jgi:hypothetical protein